MGRGRPKGPEKHPYPLRLDPGLLAAIKRLAASEFRSANGLMEQLLKEALARRGIRVPDPEIPDAEDD